MYIQQQSSGGVLQKKSSKKILQNPYKNICAEVSFLIKLETSCLELYWKRIPHRCLPKTFEKFLKKSFYRTSPATASECNPTLCYYLVFFMEILKANVLQRGFY